MPGQARRFARLSYPYIIRALFPVHTLFATAGERRTGRMLNQEDHP